MSRAYFQALAMIVAIAAATLDAAAQQKLRTGPVETGPGTLSAARKYLEGQWTLVSYEIFPAGKPPFHLQGDGTLLYDDFGNLHMDVRVDDKTALILEDAGIPTTGGVLSTKGRTAIDLQARTLVFVLEGQPAFGMPSGPLALNRPRHWQVEGDVLTLTTKGDDGKPLSISKWKKAL